MTLVFQPEDLIKCQSMWVENIPISIVSTLIEIVFFVVVSLRVQKKNLPKNYKPTNSFITFFDLGI